MATVIQEQQRSHDARPPRWERTQRAALCEPYRALQAQGLSLRQAAQALAVPRSTLQAWRAHQDRLDEQPAVVAFFPRAPVRACLHRLGLGVPLVWTAVGACGIRLGCLRVKRTGLDRFVAASYGAPPQGNRQVEEAIVAYRREASARVATAMPAPALTVAKDETSPGGLCLVAMAPKSHDLLLEQAAPARAQDTWQARMAPALSGLHCQGIPSPRDAAPGRRAYVAPHLGAQHAPDVCHGQHALGKAVSGPRATQPRAAPQAATAAPERREHGQEPLQGAGNAPANRGPGRPPQATARLAPLAQEAHVAHQACERLSAPRAQVAQRSRAIGPASHGVAGARGGRRNGQRMAAASQAQMERVRTVAPPEGLRQSGGDRRGQAARVGPKRPATSACVAGEVRQQVAQRDVPPPVSDAMPAQRRPSFSLERVARPRTGSAGAPGRKLAEGLRTALCAPGGAWATWSEAEQSARPPQAPERAAVCQRASANVAGRHGALSLRHHQLRG